MQIDTLTSYAESKGKAKFDWRKWLKRKNHKDGAWKWASKRAAAWVTCACGNQCAIIPRGITGVPLDNELAMMGGITGFYGAVAAKNASYALKWLEQIEKRSAYLINREKRKALVREREKLDNEITALDEDLKYLG